MGKPLLATAAIAALAAIAMPPAATAHHSQAAYTLAEGAIQLTGVVKKFEFTNPHAVIYLEVTGEDGKVVEWTCETQSVRALKLNGWLSDSIKPGDHITLYGRPARNGSPSIYTEVVQLPDGRALKG